jgi:enamine deaminase RidA (YjgF/YER057c/UK114 family)
MFKNKVAVIASAALILAAFSLLLQTVPISFRAVNPPGAEISPNFTNGIQVGDTLYLAGQQGTDSSGHLLDGTGPQTQAALESIQSILQADGYSLRDVVAVTVYLADMHDFPEMNKAYVSIMPSPKPTRTTIQAAALVNNARVEISATAVRH